MPTCVISQTKMYNPPIGMRNEYLYLTVTTSVILNANYLVFFLPIKKWKKVRYYENLKLSESEELDFSLIWTI